MNFEDIFEEESSITVAKQKFSIERDDTFDEKEGFRKFCLSDPTIFVNQLEMPVFEEDSEDGSSIFYEGQGGDKNKFYPSLDEFFESFGRDIFIAGRRTQLIRNKARIQGWDKESDNQEGSNTQAAENSRLLSRLIVSDEAINNNKQDKDIRRGIEKNDKYDAMRDIVLGFEKIHSIKLSVEKMNHRSHQWLLTRLVKLRLPEMGKTKSELVQYLEKSYENHINSKYFHKSQKHKQILLECVKQIIQGAKIYLSGDLDSCLELIYHFSTTKNRVSRQSMQNCRKKILQLEQKLLQSST